MRLSAVPSDHDKTCSAACLRAGIGLLVISGVALSIGGPIRDAIHLQALADYNSERFTIKQHMDLLDNDPGWQSLVASRTDHPARTEWPLERLLNLGGAAGGQKIESLHKVAAALGALQNETMLGLARRQPPNPPSADRAIYEWLFLRFSLITGAMTKRNEGVRAFASTGDQAFKGLTLPELKLLADQSAPTLESLDTLYKSRTTLSLSWIGATVEIWYAVILVQTSMLLVFFYFWLFYREARISPTFPSGGTLFGALARTSLSRLVFLVFVATPPSLSAILVSQLHSAVWPRGIRFIILGAVLAALTFYISVSISRKRLPRHVHAA